MEMVGYAASLLVAVSLTMKKLLRLRVINLLGAGFFVAYGLLISAYPVAAVNGFIAVVDAFFLWKQARSEDAFQLMSVDADSELLRRFLNHYGDDLRRIFPELDERELFAPDARREFVLRNLLPVGLFCYKLLEGEASGNVAEVLVDYVIPPYRDFKNARFLFSRHGAFAGLRVDSVRAVAHTKSHARYLEKFGFVPEGGRSTRRNRGGAGGSPRAYERRWSALK
ncbi:MAG: hypothetical protein Kow0069_03060 [Promethearchaeota archaeon]